MTPITYLEGDATSPRKDLSPPGCKHIIAHVCNDVGGWGAGFVMALSAKDKRPEDAYRDWFAATERKKKFFFEMRDRLGYEVGGRTWKQTPPTTPLKLGESQTVFVFNGDPDVMVRNMVAQRDTGYSDEGQPPIRYAYLWHCLVAMRLFATCCGPKLPPASVHMPRIGCGLAGGQWPLVETLIEGALSKHDVPVFVYDLPVYNKMDSGCFAEQEKKNDRQHS